MHTGNSWLICEKTGRWAAALRVALARRAAASRQIQTRDRIREIRFLPESTEIAVKFPHAIALVEATYDNLPEVLQLAARSTAARIPVIALLHESLACRERKRPENTATDILLEAGVLAVIPAPRNIAEIFALSDKVFSAATRVADRDRIGNSLEAWALAQLPWQDA